MQNNRSKLTRSYSPNVITTNLSFCIAVLLVTMLFLTVVFIIDLFKVPVYHQIILPIFQMVFDPLKNDSCKPKYGSKNLHASVIAKFFKK